MKPAEQILYDVSRAVAGQRATIAHHHAATASDALDALATSEAFTGLLVTLAGTAAADTVRSILADAADAPSVGWAY